MLKIELGLSEGELSDLKKGKVLTKPLSTTAKQELAILGVARINVPGEYFVKHYKKEGMNLETVGAEIGGRFSDEPHIGDVRSLSIPWNDLKALTKCEQGDCKVKATSEIMVEFRKLDSTAPDFEDEGNRVIRKVLVEYVQNYLKSGNIALPVYRDKEHPVRMAEEYQDLFSKSFYTQRYAPLLRNYFQDFPREKLPNAEGAIYWSREDLGNQATRPVFSVNHLVFYERPDNPGDLIVGSKQLYASHYFEAALGLTLMVEDREGDEPGFFLIHINQSRIDVLREIPGLLRNFFTQGVHDLLKKRLKTVKARLETAYRTAGSLASK